MRSVMLMNAKGGCGKTTLATNIATWYADEGLKVALADFDPQKSSLDWLEARQDYAGIPDIQAIDATDEPIKTKKGTDLLIMDAPAGTHGKAINKMLAGHTWSGTARPSIIRSSQPLSKSYW
ncbi:nucleotide-binding protein [endosymbiont of Lamellibrachia barhami]|uniref:nucleotide-binding protein n=1 Tax=endosymbiont of Lamellibrachia barhami TaxID=205975 RepID=UPI0015AF3DB0|nr:AAA family ATPase [endosymbiont of Lamellibrachia barhami]